MAAPTIYASTDTSAPTLTGSNGSLVALLDACLVSGYGSKAAAGWTKPYTSGANLADFRQGSSGMYLHVHDDGTNPDTAAANTGAARDAATYGYETMSAYNTGTGRFPTSAAAGQIVNYCRKSATADATARAWLLAADARTFHLFVLTGDQTGAYFMFSFGDIYSFLAGDAYKCAQAAQGTTSSAAATTSDPIVSQFAPASGAAQAGRYIARCYTGLGGSTNWAALDDALPNPGAFNPTTAHQPAGTMQFPNPSDGGLYIAPWHIGDGSTPGTSLAGTINLRGRIRGLYTVGHAQTNFTDRDTFSGTGDYAGKTFMLIKAVRHSSGNVVLALETTEWAASS